MLFPTARYDDQFDSTAQALVWGQAAPGRARNVRMRRRLAEEAEG
jgi:hypothetical protein